MRFLSFAALSLAPLAGALAAQAPFDQRPADRSPSMPRGADAAWWSGRYTPRGPETSMVDRSSSYVRMRDGVRLAVDLYLPKGLPAGRRLPTIIEQTRYFRSTEAASGKPGDPCSLNDRAGWFAARGYAYLVVDVRGTGASFGSHPTEFGDAEIRDGGEVVDWIVAQPWSDGKVGATGVSYVGTTAELLLANHNPAVKAVAPQFAGYDFYAEISFPGGVRNERFNSLWGLGNQTLDAGRNPAAGGRPPCAVDGPDGPALRSAALAEHRGNSRSAVSQAAIEFRDDVAPDGDSLDARSPFGKRAAVDRLDVPTYVFEGWTDIGYARGGVNRFINSTNRDRRLVIGAWNHGGNYFYAPGAGVPTRPLFWTNEELLRFFDTYLKDARTGLREEPPIHYFTTGANTWRSTRSWPPAGLSPRRWCFASAGALDRSCRGSAGSDFYLVRTDATSGATTRWDTALGGPVVYPDRREEDAKLLTYTSPPLGRVLEVTGQPVVQLAITSDRPDGNVILYLEEVKPDGRVDLVTEGEVRLSHGRPGRLPYRTLTPQRSDRRADSLGDVSGTLVRTWVTMLPTSHVFAAGSSLRIALAGADGTRFAGMSAGATYRIHRGGVGLSSVVLPSARR